MVHTNLDWTFAPVMIKRDHDTNAAGYRSSSFGVSLKRSQIAELQTTLTHE